MYIINFRPKKFPNIEPKCTSKEQFNITKVQVSLIQSSAILNMISLPPIDHLCEPGCRLSTKIVMQTTAFESVTDS